MLRGRVKATAARLAGLLKGYGGEVSDKGGRMCVAVPAGGSWAVGKGRGKDSRAHPRLA